MHLDLRFGAVTVRERMKKAGVLLRNKCFLFWNSISMLNLSTLKNDSSFFFFSFYAEEQYVEHAKRNAHELPCGGGSAHRGAWTTNRRFSHMLGA